MSIGLLCVGAGDPAVAPMPACRIDVWLAGGLETNSSNFWWKAAHNRDLLDKDGRPSVLVGMLTPSAQRMALATVDLSRMFGMSGAAIVWHDDRDEPVAMLPAEPASCGGSLIMRHIVLSRGQLSRAALQGVIAWQSGPQGGSARSFTTLVTSPLPESAGDSDPTIDEPALRTAFIQDVLQFAHYVTASHR